MASAIQRPFAYLEISEFFLEIALRESYKCALFRRPENGEPQRQALSLPEAANFLDPQKLGQEYLNSLYYPCPLKL